MVKIAASYVGLDETPPRPVSVTGFAKKGTDNSGWYNKDYEKKFKALKPGWYQGNTPWCVWFTQLIWKEAYTTGNAFVKPASETGFGDFYSKVWTELKDGKAIRAHVDNVATGKKDFGPGFKGTDGKIHSKWVPIADVKAGKYFPKPGDICIWNFGHADMVVATKGKPTDSGSSFDVIGGNTIANGRTKAERRDGGQTAYKPGRSYKKVRGFGVVITPSNIDKDSPSFKKS